MAASGYSPSGGMYWHPYLDPNANPKNPHMLSNFRHALGLKQRGSWVHNPWFNLKDAFFGANLATTIGQGNYATRNFRQKPVVGLETATHRKIVKPDKSKVVDIPSVSQRRVKNYKNKILTKNKAMPYRRTYRKTYKKKGKKRFTKRKKFIPLALPRQRVVRMRVVARGSITANAGVVGIVKMKANSLNDPTTDFGATLPLGLDQWAAQYQKYIVLGCKVKARFIPTTATGPVNCGLHLADNNTALANTDHYKELPNTVQGICTTQKDYLTRVIKYSGKRFWRLTNIKDDSEQEAAFSTTPGDPTDLAYIHVYVQDMQGANNTTVEVQVEQEFIVLLTDPVTLAQSSL